MPVLFAFMAVLHLSITTDGGFTGRGVGRISIDGDKVVTERCEGALTAAEREQLTNAAAAVKKLKLRDSYGHAAPDAVEWTLQLDDRKTSWYDGNDLPKELSALQDAAWKVRARVVSDCR